MEAKAAAEDGELIAAAVEAAEALDWSEGPWPQLVSALKAKTGR